MSDPASIGIAVLSLTAILGLFWLMTRIASSFKESIKKDFNTKLAANKEFYEEKFKNIREDIDSKHAEAIREVEHIKEVQEGKLTEMGKKIDDLRETVAKGQEQTMNILTKLLTREE